MCAISGIFAHADAALVERMNEAMAHRGPDDSGLFVDERHSLALGHRRLSIIDPGPDGHQPMISHDGRWRIVFNGEIYNYRQLRDDLLALGHEFRGSGDTEVLLAAWAQWDVQCLQRLDGMFAFAIHDRDARGAGLFLARDRLGIKPLYWCMRDGDFLFASELKALLASGRIERALDVDSLGHYLSLGAMPQPATAIHGVHMLAPGHYLEVTAGQSPTPRCWWDLAAVAPWKNAQLQSVGREQATASVRDLLEAATQRHMVADVEVGAFLSGGLDSSAVVALMRSLTTGPVKTFSVGFDAGDDADERHWARRVAERFATEHEEVVVGGEDVAVHFDAMIAALDQPSLDGTNSWLVSRAAGVSLKVALSGVGGDELFAGYAHFHELLKVQRSERYLACLSPRLRNLVNRCLPHGWRVDSALLDMPRERRWESLRNLDSGGELAGEDLQTRRTAQPLSSIYRPWLKDGMDVVRQTSYVEMRGYLVNTLLRDLDAMSMAHSLEVRPLLLDHHLVEYVFALPSRLKLGGEYNKPLLADAVSDLLPADLIRRPKRGFELPLRRWLNGPLRERARAAFSGADARQVFSRGFVDDIDRQLRARECHSISVWAWFSLLEWMQAQRCTLEL